MSDGDFQTSVRAALAKLSNAIGNATTLTVETSVLQVPYTGTDDQPPRVLVGRTELRWDGDSKNWIPVLKVGDDYQIQQALYDEHKAAVDKAKEARAELLPALETLLGELKKLLDS